VARFGAGRLSETHDRFDDPAFSGERWGRTTARLTLGRRPAGWSARLLLAERALALAGWLVVAQLRRRARTTLR